MFLGHVEVVLPACFAFKHLAWKQPEIAGAARVGNTRGDTCSNDRAQGANELYVRSAAARRLRAKVGL